MNVIKSTVQFFRHYSAASWRRLRRDTAEGSISPLFKYMLLVGTTGYAMQYLTVWRYRNIEKQEVVREALKSIHHH